LAGSALKRYPVTVVSENVNLPVTEQAVPLHAETRGTVPDDRSRLQKLHTRQSRNFTELFARTLAEEDADTVHDLRVCTRRLQQILAALAPEKSLSKARSVRRTLRRVRRALGPWRNCDVALQWVTRKERRSSSAVRKRGWKLVLESIAAERKHAITRARRRLYKSDGVTVNHRIQQLLALPAERLGSVDPGAVVRQAVADAAEQWHQALDRARAERSVQNIHALRIQTKRLRYRVELARDLGATQALALIQWFKLLQDRLGRWHDRQELSRFITRALAASDVLIEEPRVAVELLKEVERDIKISSREVDELFQLATDSDGARLLKEWVGSYCAWAAADSTATPDGPVGSAPPQSPASQQQSAAEDQPQSLESDAEAPSEPMKKNAPDSPVSDSNAPRTLAVDIGGTGIKTIILDPDGKPLTERERIPTPPRATPKKVMAIIEQMARQQGEFDRVSVGFPGVVKDGKLLTAFNLGPGWTKFDFQKALGKQLMRPVRIANDADVQGMGSVSGDGIELLITLGTGVGSSLFVDGHLAHLEMGHHPFRKGRTYEDELGEAARKKKGPKKWNKHVREAIEILHTAFNFDRLYLGGGNSRHIRGSLPANVQLVSNLEGLLGGVMLWREQGE